MFRLKALDDNMIAQAVDKLKKAMNCNSDVDLSLLLPSEAEVRKAVDMPTHLKSVEDMKPRIDTIAETKLDKGDDLRCVIKEADEAIRSVLQSDESEFEARIHQGNCTMTTLLQNNRPPTPEKLSEIALDETLYKLFGTQSERRIRNTCDVEAIVKHSVAEDLGRKFVAQLISSTPAKQSSAPTLYPINDEEQSVESLRVRDSGAGNIKVKKPGKPKLRKSLNKIAKMKNECDDMLALFDSNLNSWSVQTLFDNIAYIDHITKYVYHLIMVNRLLITFFKIRNHKQVLEAINDPSEVTQPQSPESGEETEDENMVELEEEADEDIVELEEEAVEEAVEELVKESMSKLVDEVVPELPQQIRFYPTNNHLSLIMATSLTEYTKQLYFSDLTQRVENLEKRLQ